MSSATLWDKFWFGLRLLLEFLDLVSDWLFFTDVALAEQGLVFGPYDPALVWAVLAFAIIGTLTLPVQYYIIKKGTISQEPDRTNVVNILDLIIFVVEDIPQAIILLTVSLCREEPSSMFQLTKASFMLATCFVKVVLILFSYCKSCWKGHTHYEASKECNKLRLVLFILTMLEMSITIVVFLATQVKIAETGELHLPKPITLVDDIYDHDRYFTHVSLFIHDPNLLTPAVDLAPGNAAWLRVGYISNVKQSGYLNLRLESQKTGNITMLRVWEKDGDARWEDAGCYNINGQGEAFTLDEIQCSFSAPSFLYMTFKYIKPHFLFKKQVLGDITFNAEYRKCRNDQTIDVVSSDFTNSISSDPPAHRETRPVPFQRGPIIMHYFKHTPIASNASNKHVMETDSGGLRLFRNEKDELIDAQDVWKTGWCKCSTTGSVGPNFDSGITVDS